MIKLITKRKKKILDKWLKEFSESKLTSQDFINMKKNNYLKVSYKSDTRLIYFHLVILLIHCFLGLFSDVQKYTGDTVGPLLTLVLFRILIIIFEAWYINKLRKNRLDTLAKLV